MTHRHSHSHSHHHGHGGGDAPTHAAGHTHDGDHRHGHAGSGGHAIGGLWLPALRSGRVHRIGRRGFLADLGRKSFAVAVLGAGVVACGGDDDDAAPSSAGADPTVEPTTGEPEAADSDTPTEPVEPEPVDDAPVDEVEPSEAAVDELRWSQVSLGFVSAYVLVRGNEAAVVDTGNPGSGADIAAALSTLGVGWGEVRHVILTHSHGDHVGGLSEVLAEAPTATTYAGAADIESILTPVSVQAVGDGDEVLGLEVIETPGHTPGSISVLDTGIGLLVAGDALNTDESGSSVTGPNPSFTADMGTANESVAKLASLEFETLVVGHGNPVTSGADDLLVDLVAGG